jgi:anti-sigma B factor antagonist
MSYSAQQDGSRTTVRLRGDLDLSTIRELVRVLDAAIADPACTTVVVDLAGVTSIDTSTIAVLVRRRRAADGANRKFLVAAPSDHVRAVLDAAGVLEYLGGATIIELGWNQPPA